MPALGGAAVSFTNKSLQGANGKSWPLHAVQLEQEWREASSGLRKDASIAQGWLADHEAPKETKRELMLMLDQPLPPKRAPIAYVADGSQRSVSQERMALSATSELEGLLSVLCAMVTRRPRLLVAALVAGWNGLIALVVLLIAPLGLAAVLTLTLLITLNSFAGFVAGSRVIGWLEPGGRPSGAERSSERQRLRGTRG